MSFDYLAAINFLESTRIKLSKEKIARQMEEIIVFCDKIFPHPDWRNFLGIDYEADLLAHQNWLNKFWEEKHPETVVRGLWFGLFNPVRNGETVADIYINTCSEYDSEDPECNWIYSTHLWDNVQYAHSDALADIYRNAYHPNEGLRNAAEYSLCLSYGVFMATHLLHSFNPDLSHCQSDKLGVVVGFDSGDIIRVGELSQSGLLLHSSDINAG